MPFVLCNINDELLTELSRTKTLPRLLDLYHCFYLRKEKVNSRCTAGVTRSPLFGSYVIERNPKKRMEKVLDVILIIDVQCWTALAPDSQLFRDKVESLPYTV